MSDINEIDEDSVTFKSIIDGSRIGLTPERAIEIQNDSARTSSWRWTTARRRRPGRGAMNQTRKRLTAQKGRVGALGLRPRARLDEANERTVRWLERCKAAHARADDQALFGIVQGGTDPDRRATESSSRSATSTCRATRSAASRWGRGTRRSSRSCGTRRPHARGQAPVPDGRGVRAGHRARRSGRGGHVRLRAADAERAERQRVHAGRGRGADPAEERAVRGGSSGPIEPGCDCLACDPARPGGPPRRAGAMDGRPWRAGRTCGICSGRRRCSGPSS